MPSALKMFGRHSLEFCIIDYHPQHPVIDTIDANISTNTLNKMEEKLAHLTSLQQESGHNVDLHLRNKHFSNNIFTTMNKFPALIGSLKCLVMTNNGITANGLATFLSNFIPVNGIKPRNQNGKFKKLLPCKLCRLELSHNKLGDEGALLLAQFLDSPNCHLVSLSCQSCKFTIVGQMAVHMANKRRKNQVKLDLMDSYFDDTSDEDDSNEEDILNEDSDKTYMDGDLELCLSDDISDMEDSGVEV